MLELARQCGVDAVLVRDPALLAIHAAHPELDDVYAALADATAAIA